jgi:GDPmannose 4,6-dehydratase
MCDSISLGKAVMEASPDEIYNLAAQSFVGTSFEQPLVTANVDGMAVVALLDIVRQLKPSTRIYHAATSELFGNCNCAAGSVVKRLCEKDILWPASPYAASKLYSYHMVRIYKEAYGMFAVNGILFNHESPLRGLEFVTRKISNGLVRIKLGLQEHIYLGNLDSIRDWGYAPEYVEAMWLMLQSKTPVDYVIGTGQAHSVNDFVLAACERLGLDPADVVRQDKKCLRPLEVNCLIANADKACTEIGWRPKTDFKGLVAVMVDRDMERWTSHLSGKIFPWDAINDPLGYRSAD